MNARIRLALILLAGAAGSAMAQPNSAMPEPPVQGFIASTMVTKTTNDGANVHPISLAQPCTSSTFSELGHGHGDVANAGYASIHCPHYDQRVDTSAASKL